MEEYNKDYNNEDYDYQTDVRKSLLGYKIVICILAVILAALSVLYYNINRKQRTEYQELETELEMQRDSLKENINSLISEYRDKEFQNDTITANLRAELENAYALRDQLENERRLNYNKLRSYEKELGTLRSVLKSYLRQIDSLNNVNQKLITENTGYRQQISTANQRAEMAEEKSSELTNIIQQGSIIHARGISITPLNARGKDISKVKSAAKLRVDMTLTANSIAKAGERPIYVRILADGYVLTPENTPHFTYEGGQLPYTAEREVDYQNEDLDVTVFYDGSGFAAGTYKVEVYTDGYLIGSKEMVLK
ncbi:MAG: hypothetical protein J1E33_00105 [Alistipes sp.]|nr:hypothetical protein [Alistipes sp.]